MVLPNEMIIREVAIQISQGHSVELVCRGNSMNPFLADRRDSIILSPCNASEIRKGDVILARDSSGRYLVHRVVSTAPLFLNGDGNRIKTVEFIPDANVIAIMTAVRRKNVLYKVDGITWKLYSLFWEIAGILSVGEWSLRRILLAVWRRLNPELVTKN